jgi:3-oxoacyl-[acyl-carrier-protein] synthase II
MLDDKQRIVVTGLGMITSIGSNVDETIKNALKGISGIKETKSVDTKDCYAKLASEVTNYDINSLANTEGLDRVSKFGIKAAREALEDAKLGKNFEDDNKVSVIFGSCVGGAVSIESYYRNNHDKDDILRMPISAIANDIANDVKAGGVITNIANACAAGTISIAYGATLIREGKANIVLAGGSDSFASVPYAGFLALHALAENPCSPFNKMKGITLGEGAGCVILETLESAKKRGAKIYCEVLGSGVSSDAHHITAPREDGEGQMNAINWAIENAGVKKSQIGYINAHGTGTVKNDMAEFLSIHTIFDGENDNISVSSTKSMVGHCLGAAGAIEACFAIRALVDGVCPPTIGYEESDMETFNANKGKLDFIANEARKKDFDVVMSNSFAFGGNNASIIFSKNNKGEAKFEQSEEKIAITGIGALSPLGVDFESNKKALLEGKELKENSVATTYEDASFDNVGLKRAFYRKLDNLCKMQAISGMQALKDSNYEMNDESAKEIGIVVGTALGALGTCLNFQDNITEKGNANGSAFNFPNTVYNAAGGYLSICSGIKGYNVTVTNGAQAGLQAVSYGVDVLKKNIGKAIMATGIDENIEIINEIYSKLGFIRNEAKSPFENGKGFALSDGAISLMLERDNDAKARGAKVYGHVLGCGLAHKSVEKGTLAGSENALKTAIYNALNDAKLNLSDIDAVEGFANGDQEVDNVELKILSNVFQTGISVFETKKTVGEARAAGAMISLIDGLIRLDGNEYETYFIKDNKVSTKKIKNIKNVLVISYGYDGSYSAVIISK